MQPKNQPRSNQSSSVQASRSNPVSCFIHGVALLTVFFLGVSVLTDALKLISPKTFSNEVLAFSSPEHLEYYCSDRSFFKGDDLFSDVCGFVQDKEESKVSVQEIHQKYYPISVSFVQHEALKDLIHNVLLLLGLVAFLRLYRRQ